MKERPILFNGPMVRAILDGRKTQTRMMVKPQPFPTHWEFIHGHKLQHVVLESTKGCFVRFAHSIPSHTVPGGRIYGQAGTAVCPHGKPGDQLWVREMWGSNGCLNCPIHYRSTEPDWKEKSSSPMAKWLPSIYMPRWASRITLEITGIRVERLQEISNQDAMAEGICDLSTDDIKKFGIEKEIFAQHQVRAFQLLWESINGPGSWDLNPWVWVIEFKRIN